MALLRGFSKVDEQGKIAIPTNIQRAANLKPGQLVEVKVQGQINAEFITVKARKVRR